MENIQETLLSQYANSPAICTILNSVNESIDPRENINEFYQMAVNILTARGFGLDIWGRIVGISRDLSIPDPNIDYFGFKETKKYTPFDQSPFYGGNNSESSYMMDDSTFREVILMKAFSNILHATAHHINRFLSSCFIRGRAYYLITGHMTARYVFEYRLSEFEKNLIYNRQILPRPSGVKISITELPLGEFFGFYGTGFQPFDQAALA
ncbi:DUF2612 domain-containing protein [Xenorhabdus cabanillasii]|uniref:Uncharacterized protein DUF2612 n=2 Tax=Xenorhabdus cabanillasii TaxID=351673 RepID=A0A3D9UPT7_9GAMM|nr:DUF2612 domain-containing protein [Xenorhabdus cabanillasii]PHM78336.1 phage protein [Xenorhabdus cabanillasii JM26]REF28665.1 uncharacterized protein DUF2612 [Xenorhabdus cabanillasii]CDL86947.1 AB1gp78 [Xenorhabdus cabanillasii JM26]